MPQPRRTGKNVLYTVITVLIVLVTIELGLHVINWAAARVAQNPGKTPWRVLYQGKTWAPTLARESDGRGQIYHQYLTWISKPQKGRFVNLNPDTGRKTWNPPNLKAPVVTLFVFGGSAAWGYGARDDYTIPSQLSHRLNAQDPHVRVYNYGEPGYTFTQGVFYLTTLLRQGARPNFVVFYDGFNDVYGAYQSGQAGTLHNVAQTKEKLEKTHRRFYWKNVKEWLKKNIYLYDKVVNKIYIHFKPEERYQEVGARLNDQQLKVLAAELVQYYAQSLDLVNHLSQSYGFKYACFWQPALYSEAKVLPQETKIDVRLGDKKLAQLYRFANQDLPRHHLSHFYNLSEAVSQRTRPCYLDLVHMTEEGYSKVADRMAKILRKDFALGD